MIQDKAFLQAIIENPDDESLRLVYADYLEEHGQPERADFIRVQCQLASLPDGDPRWVELEARERELLDKHQDEWLGPIRPCLAEFGDEQGYQFRRGFVEEIHLSAADFLREAEPFLQAHPVRRVRLLAADEEVEGLARSPCLARLTSLDYRFHLGGDFGFEHLRLLLASPYLSHLKELGLTWANLNSAGMEVLVTSPVLTQLRGLTLSGCGLGPQAMQSLTASPSIQGLTFFDVNNNTGIGAEGVRAIASCPYLAGLKTLCLGFTNSGDGGAQAVAGSPNLKGLTELDLTESFLGDAGLEALANSPHLGRLSTLCLDLNHITPAGVRALAQSSCLHGLEHLALSTWIGEEVAQVFAAWRCLASVEYLYLAHGGIGDEGARALAGSTNLARLRCLWLLDNAIGDTGAEALAASPHLDRLVDLGMSDNPLSERGRQVLRERFGDDVLF